MTELLSLPSRPLLRLNAKAGDVTVACEEREDILIERGLRRASDANVGRNEIAIRGSFSSLLIRCPQGTNLNIGSLAGRVEVFGLAGDVRVNTASGRIRVENATRVDLRSMSGRIEVGRSGDCRVSTKSGRISIAAAGQVHIASISGTIELGRVEGPAHIKSVSGQVRVGGSGHQDVEVHSISGSVTVLLPEGTRPDFRLRSLAAKARNSFPAGSDCRVAVSTLSGTIELVTAE